MVDSNASEKSMHVGVADPCDKFPVTSMTAEASQRGLLPQRLCVGSKENVYIEIQPDEAASGAELT